MRLGWMEILLVVVVLLLFFGPTRLPKLGNSIGSAIRSFKRGIGGQEEPAAESKDKGADPETKA